MNLMLTRFVLGYYELEIHVSPDPIRIGIDYSPRRSVLNGKAALHFSHFEKLGCPR